MGTTVTDYSYTTTHDKEQWAWEFLRRNPEYQRDYNDFIHRWHDLEDSYGKADEHDEDAREAWRIDIRSLANEWDNKLTLLEELPGGATDNNTQEPIPIEQWMSQKWGLDCFPLDPHDRSPELFAQVKWHEQKIDLDEIRFDARTTDPIAQVNFDLRYSLQDQLDAAHKDLITLTAQLQRLGKVKLVAADHYADWLEQIKYLDDNAATAEQDDVNVSASIQVQQTTQAQEATLSTKAKQLQAVQEMCRTGYRKILLMRG